MSDPAGREELEVKLGQLTQTLERLDAKVSRLDEWIRGNGQIGLVAQVALLERRIEATEGFIREFHSLRKWVVTSFLGMLGTLVWNIAQSYLQNR